MPAPIKNLFVEALGAAGVLDDDETRARHAGGQAYLDLVRRRSGDAADAPDAVLLPPTTAAVADVLSICSRERVAVVPWGGGTSVVGGLSALRGSCESVVALDLGRLDRLLAVDPESLTATFEPGVRTPDAERALSAHGLTIGHVPQSFERATLGGYVVTRSAGQASSGVGRIDDLVVGCRLQTPSGELVLGPVAGSAAGPDLRRLVLGSEGIFGVVTEVTLRVRRLPDVTHYEGWVARDWDHGLRILRRLAQDGPRPDIVRLSDPDETRISMAMSGTAGWQRRALGGYLRLRGVRTGCLLIVGYEGGRRDVHHRRREVRRVLRADHAVPLGTGAGQSWERHRFAAPYLRDTLLDAGVLAETLETATTWTQLPALYLAVRSALAAALAHDDRPPLVGCHVSHLYPTGGSLYFTVLARAVPGNEIEQWSAAKAAANRAIAGAGGTATHHHAVGTAHQDIVTADLGGAVGVTAMRAVKAALDPAGIMNPGKLLPGPPDV
ncbi:MAG TPA: FAD-binding oxidoreductase [Mycobacteriales bacterium]|nr:FAD-binding oxidoreductase [Mycobacteriales bacterium]